MNTFEIAIHESLESIQVEPDEALRNRVMIGAASGTDDFRVIRRRLPLRAAAIAAIIAALVLTTAFTLGNEIVGVIRQIVFGNSIAKQVDADNVDFLKSLGIMNATELSDAEDYPLGLFYTLEEARQAAPFPIREPSYMPENITGLNSVGVWRAESENGPLMHFVIVAYNMSLELGGNALLELRQIYAGPDAYFDIESVSSIEKVMVGDTEAVLITTEGRSTFGDGDVIVNVSDTAYALYWIKYGIAFELNVDYHDGYSPETMIRIAESIT